MDNSPYKPPGASLQVEVSALRESDFVKAYACFAVSSMLVGAIAGAILGFVIGSAAVASGTAGPGTSGVVVVISTIAGVLVNYFVFRFFVIRFIVVKFVPELKRAT